MPYQRVTPEKLSHSVTRQIEQLILRGVLRPGERLPSERELSEKLGVSRPSLREALGEMQASGLLKSRPSAGAYVSEELNSVFPKALVGLFANHEEAVMDYLTFRRDMEGLAAERAARLGSDTDLRVIATLFTRMEEMHDRRNPGEEARLDAEFHMSIVEASHNVVMLHMMRSMYHLLREGVFYNRQRMFRQKSVRDKVLEQHRAINTALQARDAAEARRAVETHLDFVAARLKAQSKADHNEAIARQKYRHEQAR